MPLVRVRFKANGPVLHRIVIDNETVTVPAGDNGVNFRLPLGRHSIAWFVRGAYPEVKYSILANSGKTIVAYRANVELGTDLRSYDTAEFMLTESTEDAAGAVGAIAGLRERGEDVIVLHDPVTENPDDYATLPTDEEVSFIAPDALPQ